MSKSSCITAALDGSVSDDKIKLLLFAGVSIASVARRTWTCKHDNNTEDISAYYSGVRE